MATTEAVLSIDFHISRNAARGLSPAISKAIEETAMATTAASTGAAMPYSSFLLTRGSVLGERAGHVGAEVGLTDGGWIELGDDSAAQHHQQAVGETDQFLEVC